MSMYRFVKSSRHESSSNGPATGSRRLFVQGTREGDDRDQLAVSVPERDDLQAVYTSRHLSSEVQGSSHEAHKVSRRPSAGMKCVTTRIVRKTTTLTRGQEKSVSESLLRAGEYTNVHVPEHHSTTTNTHYAIEAKRAKVILTPLSLHTIH